MEDLSMREYLDSEKKRIGRILIQAREANSLTQMEAAEKTGISLKTLSRMENGTSNYTIDNLITLLNEYGLKLIVVKNTSVQKAEEEYIYDTLIKFLISLPFIPFRNQFDSFARICLDFQKSNMSYVCSQLEFLIDMASRNQQYKRIIDTAYDQYKNQNSEEVDDNGIFSDEDYRFAMDYLNKRLEFSSQFMIDKIWDLYLNNNPCKTEKDLKDHENISE